MPFLVYRQFKKDQIKKSWEKVATPFFIYIYAQWQVPPDPFVPCGPESNSTYTVS